MVHSAVNCVGKRSRHSATSKLKNSSVGYVKFSQHPSDVVFKLLKWIRILLEQSNYLKMQYSMLRLTFLGGVSLVVSTSTIQNSFWYYFSLRFQMTRVDIVQWPEAG